MLDLATLAALHDKYREAASLPVADFALGPHRFDFEKQPYLMGVVNLSADSWYRESVALNADAAIRRGRELASAGICVSVETYHPSVTTACLKAGARVLNLTGTAACAKIFREV